MVRGKGIPIREVAARVGVSVSTVSRALQGNPRISVAVRERVLRESRAMGFVPRQRYAAIGVVTDDMENLEPTAYAGMMLSLLARYFSAHDYTVDLVDMAHLERARSLHIDAVIGVVFDDRIRALGQTPELPLVTVNKPMLADGFHAVWLDHAQEARQATEHLLAHGHRRIGFLEVAGPNWGSSERQSGYLAALRGAGVTPDPRWVRFTRGVPLLELLGSLVRMDCTALVNFSEDAILEVPYQLRVGLGLRIPQDISLVSLETNPVLKYLTPALTVIHQPLHELARTVVDTTLSLIRTPPEDGKPLSVRIESFLVEGGSVATLARSGK